LEPGGRTWKIGENPPNNTGYIRRVINIKKPGYAEIPYPGTPQSEKYITINMRLQELYIPDPTSPSIDPAYQIDLIYEDFRINLVNFPGGIQLEKAPELYDGPTKVEYEADSPTIKVHNETGDKQPLDYPVLIDGNTYIMFEEGFLKSKQFHEASELDLNLTFDQPVSDGTPISLTNIAKRHPLTPGIMEIRIW